MKFSLSETILINYIFPKDTTKVSLNFVARKLKELKSTSQLESLTKINLFTKLSNLSQNELVKIANQVPIIANINY